MKNQKQFTVIAVKWFDKVNGNTYHSVRVIRHKDGSIITCQYNYGYGDQYKYTALDIMVKAGWIPEDKESPISYRYERDNNYPIIWIVYPGRS